MNEVKTIRSADVTRLSVIPWTSESNSFRAKALCGATQPLAEQRGRRDSKRF